MASAAFPALAINTQGESPLNTLAKVEQLKTAQQSQQLGQIQLEEARVQQQSRQAVQAAYAKSGGDLDKTLQMITSGEYAGQASPQDVVSLQTHAVDLKTKAAILSEDQLNVQTKYNELAYNALKSYQSLPVEQRTPENLKGVMADLGTKGVPIQNYIPIFQKLAQDSSDATLKPIEYALVGQQKVLADEKAFREEASAPTIGQAQAKTAAELTEAQNKAKQSALALASMQSPEFAHTSQQAELAKTRATTASLQAETMLKQAQALVIKQGAVFATDPATGKRELTYQANANGRKMIDVTPATQEQIDKETDATRQLNDVQRRLANYDKAFDSAGQLKGYEVVAVNQILKDPTAALAHVGLGGAEASAKDYLWKQLRPEVRDLTSAYISLNSSMLTLQKAETQNRPSGEGLRLDVAAIPTPGQGADVAHPRLSAIQNVVNDVGRNQVKIGGLPSHDEIRKEVQGSQSGPTAMPPSGTPKAIQDFMHPKGIMGEKQE